MGLYGKLDLCCPVKMQHYKRHFHEKKMNYDRIKGMDRKWRQQKTHQSNDQQDPYVFTFNSYPYRFNQINKKLK